MAEANDKRRHYRAQLREAMIRASVPGASDANSVSAATREPDKGVAARASRAQSDEPRVSDVQRQEHREVRSEASTSVSVRSLGAESPIAEKKERPPSARRTPTQGTGRVLTPEDPHESLKSERKDVEAARASQSAEPVKRDSEIEAVVMEPARSISAGPVRPMGHKEPARSLIDGGEHYRGATESDLVDAWREMRRQFGMNTQNKLKARTAMRDWLRKKRNVSPESVVWYGDFVAVRSCDARTRKPERARQEDGWFLAVDPNRSGYRDSHIFDEAFVAKSVLQPGAVDDLVAPAWISEAVRLLEAQKVGKGQARPFVPGSMDDITSDMLESGEVS